jgi:hypothetical protein
MRIILIVAIVGVSIWLGFAVVTFIGDWLISSFLSGTLVSFAVAVGFASFQQMIVIIILLIILWVFKWNLKKVKK